MRFSTTTLLALPLLAAAAQSENPLEQLQAQAQYYFDKISSYIPSPNKAYTPTAAAAKAGGKTLNILDLNDWETTLRSSVKPSSTKPEEWWVLVTGGNKTCFGQCNQVETAFNETAALWAVNPTAPHLAYLNCEDQPVLCNAWGAGPPSLWVLDMVAPPAPVDIRIKGLNITTTTVKTFTDLNTPEAKQELRVYEGLFHPFDGAFAKYGVSIPIGYIFWIFAIVPSWMFMIGISFLSRTMMSKRMGPQAGARPAGAAAPGGAAPAAR
jgi:hypothetical protein